MENNTFGGQKTIPVARDTVGWNAVVWWGNIFPPSEIFHLKFSFPVHHIPASSLSLFSYFSLWATDCWEPESVLREFLWYSRVVLMWGSSLNHCFWLLCDMILSRQTWVLPQNSHSHVHAIWIALQIQLSSYREQQRLKPWEIWGKGVGSSSVCIVLYSTLCQHKCIIQLYLMVNCVNIWQFLWQYKFTYETGFRKEAVYI